MNNLAKASLVLPIRQKKQRTNTKSIDKILANLFMQSGNPGLHECRITHVITIMAANQLLFLAVVHTQLAASKLHKSALIYSTTLHCHSIGNEQ